MGFLNIYRNPQTYRNLGYLFLSFPLGIGYFVALTFAISLGGSLVALCGVGLLILAVLPLGVLPVMEFERKLGCVDISSHPDQCADEVKKA